MASVSDIHNFGDQFTQQLEKLDEADIGDRDRKAIKQFIRYQDAQRGLAASTNVNNCSDLRLSATRADTPLMDMTREDVDALLFEYKHDHEMAPGTPGTTARRCGSSSATTTGRGRGHRDRRHPRPRGRRREDAHRGRNQRAP